MTSSSLTDNQLRLLRLIEGLVFGFVENIPIRAGSVCFQPEPTINQSIKIGSDLPAVPPRGGQFELKTEFQFLFKQLARLGDCFVDLEVRHGLPFRLVVKCGSSEFLASAKKGSKTLPVCSDRVVSACSEVGQSDD